MRRLIEGYEGGLGMWKLIGEWGTVYPEKLTGPQLVEKFPAFYGIRRFITAFTRARHLSLCSARSIQCSFEINCNTVLPPMTAPSMSPHQPLYVPLLSPIRATCPTHLTRLYLTTRIILTEEFRPWSSSLCSLLQCAVILSLSVPNIPLNTLFSNTLSLHSPQCGMVSGGDRQ